MLNLTCLKRSLSLEYICRKVLKYHSTLDGLHSLRASATCLLKLICLKNFFVRSVIEFFAGSSSSQAARNMFVKIYLFNTITFLKFICLKDCFD